MSNCVPCQATPSTSECSTPAVCDDKYWTLATSQRLKLLGVPVGSNCQGFLVPATVEGLQVRGFLFDDGSGLGQFVTNAPLLTLPILNPAVSGAHPSTGSFKFIFAGSGSDPAAWNFLAAPTAGEFMLQSSGGVWSLVDVGTIPGLTGVGASGTYAARAALLSIVETSPGSGTYVVRKLAVEDGKPIVGIVDANGSDYQPIPDGDVFKHLLGFFETLYINKVIPADAAGGALANFEELPSGNTDATRLLYSPSDEKLYRAAAGLGAGGAHVQSSGATGTIATGSFQEILDIGSITIGTSLFFAFSAALTANNKVKFQLWMDGASIHEWDYSAPTSSSNAYSGSLYKSGITEGTHAFKIYARPYSSSEVFTEVQGTIIKLD